MDNVIEVIDAMIAETIQQKRTYPKPLMGGANQAPFDGEELGKFIRFVILHEVRDRLTGITTPEGGTLRTSQEMIDLFNLFSKETI